MSWFEILLLIRLNSNNAYFFRKKSNTTRKFKIEKTKKKNNCTESSIGVHQEFLGGGGHFKGRGVSWAPEILIFGYFDPKARHLHFFPALCPRSPKKCWDPSSGSKKISASQLGFYRPWLQYAGSLAEIIFQILKVVSKNFLPPL